MKVLENFTKKTAPRRRISKLKKYENEIRELYDMGYSVPQIIEFLEELNIKISQTSIYNFLAKKDVKKSSKNVNIDKKTVTKGDQKDDKSLNEIKKEFEKNPVFETLRKRIEKVNKSTNNNKEK